MALFPMKRAGSSGGSLAETELWSNPSPSSDFAIQSVTLSQSMDNFTYIKMLYAYDKSTLTNTGIVIIPLTSFNPIETVGYTNSCIGAHVSSSQGIRIRTFGKVDSTTIRINSCLRATSGTAGGTFNSQCIPLKIYGMK